MATALRRGCVAFVAVALWLGVAAKGQTVGEWKRAILMTYYGTSEDSARAVAIDATTECVRRAFPTFEVRESWTSRAAANALKRRSGEDRLLFPKAMEQLRADGFNDVVVVCCEMIAGNEYHYLERQIERFRPEFFDIRLTTPLLYTVDDCRKVLDIVLDVVGAAADEQAVLVGHGRDDAANDVYCLADYILQHEGHERYHVGTISGYPSVEEVKRILKASDTKKVVLAPLIVMAAGHATKDIFKTWREAMEAEGYEVRLVRQGVLEYPEIRQLIIGKIKEEIAGGE